MYSDSRVISLTNCLVPDTMTGYAKNGVMSGTSGLAKRLEGINIWLVPKGGKAPGSTKRPYVVGGGANGGLRRHL